MREANRPCIVGIGQSEFTKWGGIKDKSQFQITAEAIADAMRDAGIAKADLDGFASFSNDANEGPSMQVALGVPKMRWSSMVWGGGGGGSMAALSQACAAIESGQATGIAVYRGLCQGQTRRFGKFNATRPLGSFVNPFGLFAPPYMLSLQVRRFMHLYPAITELHLAEIALNARANANRNPNAVMYKKPLTLDDYLAGRWIAEPLRVYDCCLETDGACAVIVTTRERARDMGKPIIEVLSALHGSGPGWAAGPLGSHNMPDEDYASTNSRLLARDLYADAGVEPDAIDVAQIYDHFSGLVLMALEEYGFCDKGGSGEFVASGAIRWDSGKLPLNTSGGQLSEAYVHGMNLLIEGVRQLRGTSTSQVADARLCLVTGGLGVSPTSAAIIGRH
jgi:acetyl-CoA acetyltransferase